MSPVTPKRIRLSVAEKYCSETIIQKKITDHFAQIPFKTEADKIMDLCNSLESSGLSESSGINLHNQKMCTSCVTKILLVHINAKNVTFYVKNATRHTQD